MVELLVCHIHESPVCYERVFDKCIEEIVAHNYSRNCVAIC